MSGPEVIADDKIICCTCGAKYQPKNPLKDQEQHKDEIYAISEGWITRPAGARSKLWACPTCQRRKYDKRHDQQGHRRR